MGEIRFFSKIIFGEFRRGGEILVYGGIFELIM